MCMSWFSTKVLHDVMPNVMNVSLYMVMDRIRTEGLIYVNIVSLKKKTLLILIYLIFLYLYCITLAFIFFFTAIIILSFH